jgi:hypothetical protein
MKIVDSYITGATLPDDPETLATRCRFLSYNVDPDVLTCVENILLPGQTTFMFSGSWRLNYDATYIELKMFETAQLEFHKSTLFVEPENIKLYNLVLKSLSSVNLIILHSDYWVQHRTVEQILVRLDQLLPYVQEGGQIICTVPFNHIHFNRLTTTRENVLTEIGGYQINDSIVIVRKK